MCMAIPRLTLFVVLIIAILFGAAACSSDQPVSTEADGPTPTTAPEEPSSDGADLVVSIEVGGGFTMPGFDFRNPPQAVVYADGTTFSQGAVTAIYPGPAVTPIVTGTISDDAITQILAAAEEAGLTEGGLDVGQPPIADASTTTITISVDGVTHVTEVYALGLASPRPADGELPDDGALPGDEAMPGVTDEQAQVRQGVFDFTQLVSELVTAGEEDMWQPDRYRVLPLDPGMLGGQEMDPATIEWPFPDIDLVAGECVPVTGVDADVFRGLLEDATEITRWSDDGDVWALSVRPVLPHEPNCPGPA